MALVVNDRVKETSTTAGTVTFTLDGAVAGFETFSSAIGNSNTTYYAIEIPNSTEFEVGLGTVSAGQLARTTVISSSNSDALVNFSAGTKNVFCTLPASKAVIKDASDNVIFGDNEKAQFGDSNDLQIYHTGGSSYISDDGTGHLNLRTNGSDIRMIKTDGTIMLQAVPDNRVDLYYNGSKKFETTSTGAIVTGNLTATGNLTVTSDSQSNGIFLKGRSSDDIGTLKFLSNNGASSQLEISSRPTVGIFNHPTDTSFRINNTEVFGLDSSAVKVNETSADVDFIVESVNNANMLHVNAGNDRVGIGGIPTERLTVIGPNNSSAATLKVKDTDGRGILISSPYSGSGVGHIGTDGTSSALGFKVNGTEYARFSTNGYFGIGTTNPSSLLHLSSSDPQITITDTDGTGSPVIKADVNDLVLDSPGNIILDAFSNSLIFKDNGQQIGSFANFSGDFGMQSQIADKDIILRGNDNGVVLTALTLDMSEAGAAIFNDKVILGANKVIEFGDAGETISGDGTDLTIASSNNTTIDSVGSIFLDADNNGLVDFKDGGTTYLRVSEVGNNAILKSFISDGNFIIKGNDGGVDTTALTLDMSEAGAATFNSSVTVGANLDVSSGTIKLDGNFPAGSNNVALGNDALSAGAGLNNTMIGNDTGSSITSGQDNTGVGDRALRDVTTGIQNTGLGKEALLNVEDGSYNVAVGHQSLLSNVSGNTNTAVGYTSLQNATNQRNTAVGYGTGNSVTSGSNLTLLGYNAESSSATATNEITLGDNNVTSLRIPGLQSGASSGDVLTYDGTDITLSAPTGVSAGFSIAMAIAL
jgi:hypothetical protein